MTRLHMLTIGLLAGSCVFANHAAFAQGQSSAAQTGANADMAPVQNQRTATDIGTIQVQGAGAGQALGSGYILPEDGPKDRSTVTSAGIENELPTVNPFQMIGILPGVNEQEDDSIGLAGGTIRVRGLTGNQLGFTINGAPFNDSGNFNVYPSEIIDAENVKQIWITHGSTDIDAPHVGASGGNIGVVTRSPSDNFNLHFGQSLGELNLLRDYIGLDTGQIGDVKALVSLSYTHADKWRGDGSYNRRHSDGNIVWQVTPESTIGVTWVWNDSISPYYRDYAGSGIYNVTTPGQTAYQTYQTVGRSADYDTFWGQSGFPINRSGAFNTGACATHPNPACTVTNPQVPQMGATNASNYYAMNINPYRNAVITIPVHVQLSDNLRWETNGYFWWGQGGAVFGSTALDDNFQYNGYKVAPQYGDAANSTNALLLAQGTVNKTQRPGFTTKLVYDVDNYSMMAGGWLEQSHMDYGTPFSIVNADGTPCDRWLTNLNGNSCVVQGTSEFGSGPVYGYHYKSNSIGEGLFFDAQGRFLNDTLKFNAGLAYRAIIRDVRNLNPYCADDPNLVLTPGGTTTCASYATSSTFLNSTAYTYFNGPTVGAAAAYAAMRRFGANPHINYHAFLPEFTASYDIDSSQQVYASMATGLRTPSVSTLTNFTYSSSATGSNIMKIADTRSEYAYSYEAGYRWHDDFLVLSTTAYLQDLKNYLATVQLDQNDYITSNIGNVKIYGIDFEAGTKPWHGFTFYGSAEIQNSELSKNLGANFATLGGVVTTEYVATAGKQLVDTPNFILAADIGYAQDGFFADARPQCRGQRATALLNDEWVPAYCTLNLSVGYHFGDVGGLKNATLQFYGVNVTDTNYFGQIYTSGASNAKAAQAYNAAGQALAGQTAGATSYSGEPGAPLFLGARFSVDVN
jgi:iron complex outermembrane receptor protein